MYQHPEQTAVAGADALPPAAVRSILSTGSGRQTRGFIARRLRDLGMAPVWAGITAFVWYAFGALPLQIDVAAQLGLSAAQTSSWIFVVWFSGAIVSILLSMCYRIPIPITWTIPGLVYLGTLDGRFTLPEIVGANLLAGAAIVAFGMLGIGRRIMAWLPLPIVMGMFAGSILVYVIRMVAAGAEDAVVVAAAVGAYLAGRAIADPRLPPIGLAAVAGVVAVLAQGRMGTAAVGWALPELVHPGIAFSAPAVLAIGVPMVVLAMGLGNVQGLGFLMAQNYRVPVGTITVATGVASVANALLCGHPATVARTGAAILAGPEAGPARGRYWASVVAAALTVPIALMAGPVASLVAILPGSLVLTLAGLAILASFQSALETAFGGKMRFGALAAFAVAATPFALFGITSAFWSVPAGIAAALCAERQEILAYWREGRGKGGR